MCGSYVEAKMSPSRTSHFLAFSTALLLALPPGWCCPLLVHQLFAAVCSAGSSGENFDEMEPAESRSVVSCSTVTRSAPNCCHHRLVPKSPPPCGSPSDANSSRANSGLKETCNSDRITPACHTSFPDGPASDCCCLGAPPVGLVLPTSSVDVSEPNGLATCSEKALSSVSESRRSLDETLSTFITPSRQSLYCVWRC